MQKKVDLLQSHISGLESRRSQVSGIADRFPGEHMAAVVPDHPLNPLLPQQHSLNKYAIVVGCMGRTLTLNCHVDFTLPCGTGPIYTLCINYYTCTTLYNCILIMQTTTFLQFSFNLHWCTSVSGEIKGIISHWLAQLCQCIYSLELLFCSGIDIQWQWREFLPSPRLPALPQLCRKNYHLSTQGPRAFRAPTTAATPLHTPETHPSTSTHCRQCEEAAQIRVSDKPLFHYSSTIIGCNWGIRLWFYVYFTVQCRVSRILAQRKWRPRCIFFMNCSLFNIIINFTWIAAATKFSPNFELLWIQFKNGTQTASTSYTSESTTFRQTLLVLLQIMIIVSSIIKKTYMKRFINTWLNRDQLTL